MRKSKTEKNEKKQALAEKFGHGSSFRNCCHVNVFWIFAKTMNPSPKEGAITYHAIMNCLRCLSLLLHPFDCAVVAFIRVMSHLKYIK